MMPGISPSLLLCEEGITLNLGGDKFFSFASNTSENYSIGVSPVGGVAPYTFQWTVSDHPNVDYQLGHFTILSGQGTSAIMVRFNVVPPGTISGRLLTLTVTDAAGLVATTTIAVRYQNTIMT